MSASVLPGSSVGRTIVPRRVLRQAGKDREILIPIILDPAAVDGSNVEREKSLRGGWLLGRNQTTGLWGPCKRTSASASGSAATSLTVAFSAPFAVGDAITIGSSGSVNIAAVNHSNRTITLASARSWQAGDPVVSTGGMETARAVLADGEVTLRDADGAAASRAALAVIAGYVDQDRILGDTAAVFADPASRRALDRIIFDDEQSGAMPLPIPPSPLGLSRVRHASGSVNLTAADSGTLFIATAAATFFLPAKATGLMFGFHQTADANLTVVTEGSADDIVAPGDAAADQVAWQTAGQRIGSSGLLFCPPGAARWLLMNTGGTTVTPS
jgi:hypothetical protein